MKFKGTKCIEISKSEYEDILFIWSISSCPVDGYNKVYEYLDKGNHFGKLQDLYLRRKISSNLLEAVVNKYKYLKIIN